MKRRIPHERMMTRQQVAVWLREQGIPIGDSTLTKLCVTGKGPPVLAYWGKRPLYSGTQALEWAMSRVRPARVSAG